MDSSLPGSSVYGIFQAWVLEWVPMPSSRGSSPLRDWTVSFLYLLHSHAGSHREESRPWQRSWGRKPEKTQGRDHAPGVPPGISWASTPKTRVCLLYCVMLSTYSSDINGGLSPHHLFLEKINLELLDSKSPGHNKSVSIQKPLWWLSSLPARLLQLCMWLFAASQPREAQKA